jgi:hypothetical protein
MESASSPKQGLLKIGRYQVLMDLPLLKKCLAYGTGTKRTHVWCCHETHSRGNEVRYLVGTVLNIGTNKMSNIRYRYFLGLFFTWPNLYNFIFDTEKKKVVVQDTSTYVFFLIIIVKKSMTLK